MIIFISGGCKNGKSMLAQHLTKKLAGGGRLYYIATMIPHDAEDDERIVRHIKDREGWGFETIEQGRNILGVLDKADAGGAFLMDSVTALLSNEMFTPSGINENAAEKAAEELCRLSESVSNIVLVSDYIYADCERYDELTESYRRGLAYTDRCLSEIADTVIEVCTGNYKIHKGAMPV